MIQRVHRRIIEGESSVAPVDGTVVVESGGSLERTQEEWGR